MDEEAVVFSNPVESNCNPNGKQVPNPPTSYEIEEALFSLKSHKALGIYDIPTELIKEGSSQVESTN